MTDAAFYQLGPLREYLEDPTVFEIRINCFQEVICDTFSGRRVVQNAAITADFITPYLCQWQRCLKINQSGISAGDSFSPQIVRFCPVQPVSGQCRNI
ncbi:protein TraG [Klebsiella pneumoniae]|nr:protein TraG [Klebsiella pneumoniae]SYV88504.1 protein TraG [Klebsiella pneumoniae]